MCSPTRSPATWEARSAWPPGCFFKKLVGDVLDRIDQFEDFDPRRDYKLTISDGELTDIERNARAATSVEDIDLEVGP